MERPHWDYENATIAEGRLQHRKDHENGREGDHGNMGRWYGKIH